MSPSGCGTVALSVRISPASASKTIPAPRQQIMSPHSDGLSLPAETSRSNCTSVRKVTVHSDPASAALLDGRLLLLEVEDPEAELRRFRFFTLGDSRRVAA